MPEVVTQDVYNRYFQFDQLAQNPEVHPWDAQVLTGYLQQLEAADPAVATEEAAMLRRAYDAPMRSYHGLAHGEAMGQPYIPDTLWARMTPGRFTRAEAEALSAVAGLFHDVAYKHVDADAEGNHPWPELVGTLVRGVAQPRRTIEDNKVVWRTHLTSDGREDNVTKMVAHVFGMNLSGSIIHNQGGNEFDSASAAAKFLEAKGASAKHILAVTAMIAATIPFRPARNLDTAGNVIGDGHMGELAQRVKTAALAEQDGEREYQPDWFDVNDMMLLSVNLANRDIESIIRTGGFDVVIHNGRKVKKEEVEELRREVHTVRELSRAAARERSAPLLYSWIASGGTVPPAYVPHFYILRDAEGRLQDPITAAYPPLPVYEQAAVNAEENTRLADTFFRAHEAGISVVNAIATLVGEPNAEVPGFVFADLVADRLELQGARYSLLTAEEVGLVAVMMHGVGQGDIDSATPRLSPFGGFLLAVLGADGIDELSQVIQGYRGAARAQEESYPFREDPFCDPAVAKDFAREVLQRIGYANFWNIVYRLQDVALKYAHNRDRAERLGALSLA